MKHEVVCTPEQRIVHVSSMYQGKVHDKTICDRERTIDGIHPSVSITFDLGYNGIQREYPNHFIVIPPKKPKGGLLTSTELFLKKIINKRRVIVEHTIGAVKRFNIVRQIFRGPKMTFGKIFQASCALHNFNLITKNGIV